MAAALDESGQQKDEDFLADSLLLVAAVPGFSSHPEEREIVDCSMLLLNYQQQAAVEALVLVIHLVMVAGLRS